jgi:hypothetical protein
MPIKLIRLIVIALAVLLPLQGMATVMVGQCMTLGHHQDVAPDPQSHAHDEHEGHAHDGHEHDGDSKSGHCGPCTACCASASIAGPAAFVIASLRSDVAYVFTQSPPPTVQPDGLDRPPLAL